MAYVSTISVINALTLIKSINSDCLNEGAHAPRIRLLFLNGPVARVKGVSYEVSVQADPVEVTCFGDIQKTYVPGQPVVECVLRFTADFAEDQLPMSLPAMASSGARFVVHLPLPANQVLQGGFYISKFDYTTNVGSGTATGVFEARLSQEQVEVYTVTEGDAIELSAEPIDENLALPPITETATISGTWNGMWDENGQGMFSTSSTTWLTSPSVFYVPGRKRRKRRKKKRAPETPAAPLPKRAISLKGGL